MSASPADVASPATALPPAETLPRSSIRRRCSRWLAPYFDNFLTELSSTMWSDSFTLLVPAFDVPLT